MLRKFTRFLKMIILAQAVFIPFAGIMYLSYFGFGVMSVESMALHGLTILVSTAISLCIASIAYLNYKKTGEVFLRYLSLGFFAFFILYFPHSFLGIFGNMPLFLGYGTISRFTMALYLLYGVLLYKKEKDPEEVRHKGWLFHGIFLLFLSIFGLPGIILGLNASTADVKTSDYITIILFLGTLFATQINGMRRSLYWFYMVAVFFFASACLAFIFGKAWNQYWWSGHIMLIAGFYALLYTLIRKYEITASVTQVFSETELYEELAERTRKLTELNVRLSETARILGETTEEQRKTLEELSEKNKTLEKLTQIMSDRELRMVELKQQIADLEREREKSKRKD